MTQTQKNKGVVYNLMGGSIFLRDLRNMLLGLLPLGMGVFGVIQHFKIEKKTYIGNAYDLKYIHKETNAEGEEEYELKLVVEKDTIQFKIENDAVSRLLAFKSREAYKELVEKAVRDLKQHKDVIAITYHINGVSEFIVNDKTVIRYQSAFWWGLSLMTIGGAWIWIFVDIFRKDPDFKYIKDPFSKYKE